MAMIAFTYYLHDDSMYSEMVEYIASRTGLSEEQVDSLDIGRPFYEIALNCVLDTDSGDVLILSAKE